MGNLKRKEICPACKKAGKDRSGNNLCVYEDDSSYCFACGYVVPSKQWLSENGKNNEWVYEEDEVATREKLTPEEVEKIKGYTGVAGKGMREISDETYKAYGVRHKYSEETGEAVAAYYPITEEYAGSGFKVREYPKMFSVVGKCGKESDLFGQWKFKNSSGKFCVICAGEVDCLSGYEMLEDYRKSKGSDFDPIPVVSPTIGESGAYKQIANHYEWLDRFDKVIVCFDMDEAGKKATEELVKVIPKGKMFVMQLPLKDTNAMLEAGRSKQWIDAFWKARPYTPDGIVSSCELMDKIIEQARIPKIPLPPFMHVLQDMMAGGIPLGVIVNLASASGTGKSTIVEEMNYFWFFNSPHMVGVVSLEADTSQYGTKILSRHIRQKVDLIEDMEEKITLLQSPEVQEKAEELWHKEDGTPRWYLIEERDGGIESMKGLVMNLIVSCGCKVVVLDPMTDLIDSMSLEQQASFMKWQKGVVKSHGITFINISHTRKSPSGAKAGSNGAEQSEEDMMGNSAVYKSAAANLLFSRDKSAEDEMERNTIKMRATKIRWTGRTGIAGEYFYDNPSHTLWDKQEYLHLHGATGF